MTMKKPTLWFSVYAWAKLMYMRDAGSTEIAGMGIAEDENELLYVHDFFTLPQTATVAHYEIDDDAIGTFANNMLEKYNLPPAQTCRINIHTHPGNSAQPSQYDETEFEDNFRTSSFAVMMILAKGNQTYARLKTNDPFEYETILDIAVDWHGQFEAADHETWKKEFELNVKDPPKKIITTPNKAYSTYKGQYSQYAGGWKEDEHWEAGKGWVKNDPKESLDMEEPSYPFPLDFTGWHSSEIKDALDWAIDHDHAALAYELNTVMAQMAVEEHAEEVDNATYEWEQITTEQDDLQSQILDYMKLPISPETQNKIAILEKRVAELDTRLEDIIGVAKCLTETNDPSTSSNQTSSEECEQQSSDAEQSEPRLLPN